MVVIVWWLFLAVLLHEIELTRCLLPSLDLQRHEWSLNSKGRSVCSFLTNGEDKLDLGWACTARTAFNSAHFEQFREHHLRGNEEGAGEMRNFERHFMLFDVRLRMSVDAKVHRRLCGFIDDITTISHNNYNGNNQDNPAISLKRPAVSVHLRVGPYIDHCIPLNASSFPRSPYDTLNTDDKLREMSFSSKQVEFHFDYNLAWWANRRTGEEIAVELRLDTREMTDLFDPLDQKRQQEWLEIASKLVVHFDTISVSYVQQPKKFDFSAPHLLPIHRDVELNVTKQRQNRDVCHLLGSSCAVVLKRALVLNESAAQQFINTDSDTLPPYSVHDEAENNMPPLRLFCGVFTTVRQHKQNVAAVRDTWARKCTVFLAFSTEDDNSLPAINLPHIGEEIYNNMWQKSRSIWKYINTHYRDDFDWFLLGGDDMYYIVENLVHYLRSDEILTLQASEQGKYGVYLGRKLTEPASEIFTATDYNTGGPGYLLDRNALDVLMANIDKPHCYPFVMHSAEDSFLGDCLFHSTPSIRPYDTRDKSGRHRFLTYPPGPSFTFDVNMHKQIDHWLVRYDTNVSSGHDCCSDEIVSIHFLDVPWMHAINDFLFHCPRSNITDFFSMRGSDYYSFEVIPKEIR